MEFSSIARYKLAAQIDDSAPIEAQPGLKSAKWRWMRCAYPNEASAEPPYDWETHRKVILAGYAGEAAGHKAFTASIARMPAPIGLQAGAGESIGAVAVMRCMVFGARRFARKAGFLTSFGMTAPVRSE